MMSCCGEGLVQIQLTFLCPPPSGVKLMLTQQTTALFAKAGMLAPDGRCKTLDAAADGYVRGEACVVMSMQYGEQIPSSALAVFAGAASNQDARSSTLTAPNGRAQQNVIDAALLSAGLTASDIGMLQMHGTGTALGMRCRLVVYLAPSLSVHTSTITFCTR